MKNKTKELVIPVALLLISIALLVVFYGFDFRYRKNESVVTPAATFDSRDAGKSRISRMKMPSLDRNGLQDIRIRFRMKAFSLGDYSNVFQTSEGNEGLRMEISKSGVAALVIGMSPPVVLEFRQSVDTGNWHDVSIEISRDGWVFLRMDGHDVSTLEIKDVHYKLDKVVVGTGFSETRPFDGVVEQFSIIRSTYERRAAGVLKAVYLVFSLSVLSLIWTTRTWIARLLWEKCRGRIIYANLALRPLAREQKIDKLVAILSIGFASITAFFYFRGMILGLPFPLNTFLPAPVTRFGDFYSVIDEWTRLHFTGVGFGLTYFPSTYLLMEMFSWIKPFSLSLFVFLTGFSFFLVTYIFLNTRSRESGLKSVHSIVALTVMCYPVLFTIHTGNLEAIVFFSLAMFIACYQRRKFMLSALPLALAISMKAVPGVFLVLLLADRKYKEIGMVLVITAALSILPLLIFDGGFNTGIAGYIARLQASQKMYLNLMVLETPGNHFGHSLLNSLRIMAGASFPEMKKAMLPYLVFSIAAFSAIAFHILAVEKIFWKKVALLIVAMCLLPYTSTDYKLLHLMIPLLLFINAEDSRSASAPSRKFDFLFIILFALVFVPKNYWYFHGDEFYSINNLINTFSMALIALLIMFGGWGKKSPGIGFFSSPLRRQK